MTRPRRDSSRGAAAGPARPGGAAGSFARVFGGGTGWAIVVATLALFAVSPAVAPGSLNSAPLLSMLPFAAVLAIAAAGQTLVVQQRGLDLSVPGVMALGAALVTGLPQNHGWAFVPAVVAAVLAGGLVGLVNGFVVNRLGVTPLVATLGMNSLLLGTVFWFTGGTPATAPDVLNRLVLARTLGLPNTVLVALVVVIVAGLLTKQSILGRQMTAVGVSVPAGLALGIRIRGIQAIAYGFAGLYYAGAGILLVGYTRTAGLFLGDSYLLPTVAAVVLGGTALTGGIASIVSTGVAALFLTQLGQLLRAVGWTDAAQLIAQAVVLLAVVVARELTPGLVQAWRRRRRRAQPALAGARE